MECDVCGIAPCDLPDGVDPGDVFERIDGAVYCVPCSTGRSLTITTYEATTDATD